MLPINFVGVVVAAVVAFIIGFLLHGPVSGKLWMRLADIHPTGNEKLSDMIPQMLYNLLANLVTAYGLAVVYLFASSSPFLMPGVKGGMITGFIVWLGFLVPATSINVIWMGAKKSLWIFEAVCSLIMMISMGAILAHF